MADIRVSVVVTNYNYGRYLAECLDSVLGQSYPDFEIILIDDGSTDHSEQVVARYHGEPRLRAFRQLNGGQAKAKNAGIRLAQGELIAFLDADDRWRPGKLEKQLQRFADPQVGVVFSRARLIDAEGDPLPARPTCRYLTPREGEVTSYLFLDNFVPFSSAMVRRRCLKEFGGFDESLSMGIDWDLWLRLSTRYRFAYIDEPLLDYRVGHPGQMSKKRELRHSCSDRIMARFLEQHPGVLPASVIRRARAYTCCNRGHYYRRSDPVRARGYYLQALAAHPLELAAYNGLLRCLLAPR
ncbi:MAG: glycosyltransferase [Desulfuromonadales bacterium]|nr:glycosyltransferase [Desulfuromonadales bacterium]